jgi:hypothetical protein
VATDEIDKYRGHGMNTGDDPNTSSQIWTSPRYNLAASADRNRIAGPGYGDVGSPIGTRWLINRGQTYPANCQAPCTPGAVIVPGMTEASLKIPLKPGGQELLDRINQLDLSLAKWFEVGGRRLQLQADLLNAMNANPVLGWRSVNYGTAAYSQVSGILNPRVLRLGLQFRF